MTKESSTIIVNRERLKHVLNHATINIYSQLDNGTLLTLN